MGSGIVTLERAVVSATCGPPTTGYQRKVRTTPVSLTVKSVAPSTFVAPGAGATSAIGGGTLRVPAASPTLLRHAMLLAVAVADAAATRS